jgi:predicted ATPase
MVNGCEATDMIARISVRGYRLLRKFATALDPGINVLIGANGSGKSTLVDFLRIIKSCCLGPLPPGIEDRPTLGSVFHPTAGNRIEWDITLASPPNQRGRTLEGYWYSGVLEGAFPSRIVEEELEAAHIPIELEEGPPARIVGEALAAIPTREVRKALALDACAAAREGRKPQPAVRFLFRRKGDHGTFEEVDGGRDCRLEPTEPMIARATDPRASESHFVRSDILRWRFYTELRVTRTAPIRNPQAIGGAVALDETGENLASVLLSLFTNLEYEEEREELLSFLRTAVPEFERLTPTPDPTGKYVVLQWREKDLGTTLSATDLSDGVLRLLALGVICCSPHPPSLICIDEPEIGLHPRLLSHVGGLLRRASERSQVIVLTHSPELLFGMPLESIAVMRKRNGEAHVVWPKDHDILCEVLTEEVAGERELDRERLRDAFTSGEMDELE